MASQLSTIDRISICRHPDGWPIMYQTWKKLLFLHWPVQPEQLRPLIPAGLEIDTWEGTAWVAVTPFTMDGIRPTLAPPLPWLSSSHELNVRTYVHRDGVPGVWFFSLDAANLMAVYAARLGFFLPYHHADMSLETEPNGKVRFRSIRKSDGAKPFRFQASWQLGLPLPKAAPESRDFFFTERYCLYSTRSGRLYRARIYHDPWPLCSATVEQLSSTMLESHGLSPSQLEPIVHAQASPLTVAVWPLKRLPD